MSTVDSTLYKVEILRGKVSNVCDGDTLDIDIPIGLLRLKTETVRVRYAGMDTPEVAKSRPKTPEESVSEPYAEEAKKYVSDKVLHKMVSVEVARLKGSKGLIGGTRGRVVGIIRPSIFGPSLNVELVEKGYARVYNKSSCSWMTASMWKELQKAEARARRKKLRIWKEPSHSKSQWGALVKGVVFGIIFCILVLLFIV